MEHTSLGEYVQAKRNELGLGKAETARRASITSQFMRDIEDNRTMPSEKNLEILVEVLGLDERLAFKLADKLPRHVISKAKKEYYGE